MQFGAVCPLTIAITMIDVREVFFYELCIGMF